MATTPAGERLWTSVPLTTPLVLVRRSQEVGVVAVLIRTGGTEWAGLDDDERSVLARRLMFARHRTNPDDRLRHRTMPEGPTMRVWTELALNLVILVSVVGALIGAGPARVRGWL